MNRIVNTRFASLITGRSLRTLILLATLLIGASAALAQTTSFTYQGRLTDGGSPANGSYDVQVKLFDALTAGNQIGATNSLNGITVSNGVFTVTLDFGAAAFPGANRWAEISARPAGSANFTTLTPRQPVTSTPYAIKSLSAGAADSLSVSCNGCVTGAQIGSLPATSGNYIQNATTQQAGSNFNISATGKANIFDAATQYNIGGSRILSIPGTNNLFAGIQAGALNTTGFQSNFFGSSAGAANTTGSNNNFFGAAAGFSNTSGFQNSFFGASAGRLNTTGQLNAFFGDGSGINSTTSSRNAFFGQASGNLNTTGENNAFFGTGAGLSNTIGNRNTALGTDANVAFNNLINATAIGANAVVAQSNSLVLGSINGINGAIADTRVGIGTASPSASLHLRRDVSGGVGPTLFVQNGGGFAGAEARLDMATYDPGANAPNFRMSVTDGGNFGASVNFQTKTPGAIANTLASRLFIKPDGNVGLGTTDPGDRLEIGSFNDPTDNYLTIKTAGGNQRRGGIKFRVFANDLGFTIENDERGVSNGLNILRHTFNEQAQVPVTFSALFIDKQNGNVGINTVTPADRLQVVGDLRVGTGTTGCVRDADGTVIAGTCSSDLRFKKDVTPFANVLDKVTRLQPVYFNWRASEFPNKHFGNALSFGLIAQDVEQVLPELVTKDEQGFRAVNYSKLPLLTIQAVKELKAENEALKQQNATLETRLEALEQMMQQLTGQQVKQAQPKQK